MTTKEFEPYLATLDMGNWNVDLKKGVYRQDPVLDSKGEIVRYKHIPACAIPVLPTALMRNVDTGYEKVEISFKKFNRWYSIVVDRERIASTQKVVALSNEGIEVSSETSKALVAFFADVIARNLDAIPYKPSRASLGWYEKNFIPYTGDLTFDGDDQFRSLFKAIKSAGTLEEWVDFVAELRQNPQMRLMIDASFASPLIDRAGENPFFFHCWGTTSFGKTVALMVAMSIWGDPSLGALTKTLNMTPNAMMANAAFLKNVPFAGDELQTIKNKWRDNYDSIIMQLTEGIDRSRMNYDRVNEQKSWKCAFLTTGEEPAVKASSGGGAKNRVIEMECRDKLVESGNKTAAFAKTHYGTAGPVFIEAVKDMDIHELYVKKFDEILAKANTTDKQAGAMALILLADKIVTDIFFKTETALTVEDVKQYLASDTSVSVAERAYSYICDTIAVNINKFDPDANQVWGVIEGDTAYINKTTLSELLNDKGYDFEAVKREWENKGYIKRNANGYFRWYKTINKMKSGCIRIVMQDDFQQETMADDDDDLPF